MVTRIPIRCAPHSTRRNHRSELASRSLKRLAWLLVGLAGLCPSPGRGESFESAVNRPHVVLLIADDVSWNDLGCYGNTHARTPHIDQLASRGLTFTQAFLTASSCSPSRSSIVTGRYPHNNGKAAELHLAIAGHLPWFPTVLRAAGYHTVLSGKNHMKAAAVSDGKRMRPFEITDPGRVPGNRGGHGRWVQMLRDRPRDRPFFAWFASYDAHRDWDADEEWNADLYGPRHTPDRVIVPPFLLDDAATRRDLASYYNEVTRFDYFVGQVIAELARQQVLDNTLIIVMADNGRPFPRAKTRLHDSGMKTPLIMHWPQGITSPGRTCDQLVSAIDLAPTILTHAGCRVPVTMQGVDLTPLFGNALNRVRRYAFSEHNWHDYEAHGRSVRGDGYLLIQNARPQFAWQGPADSVRSASFRALLTAQELGELTPAQADVLQKPRPEYELYHVASDPHQLTNLYGQAAHAEVQQHLSDVLRRWIQETGDSVPEALSRSSFDPITGDRVIEREADYRGMTPGEDRKAALINAPGPR